MMGAKAAATCSRVVYLGLMVGLMPAAAFAVGPDATTGADADKTGACLSGPKPATRLAEHWYYRVERGTKRHCWYTHAALLPRVVKRAAQATHPANTPDVTEPASLELSVANARAEADLSAPPRSTATTTPRDVLPTGETSKWTLADRWADHRDIRPPAQPLPVQATPPPVSPVQSEDLPQESLLEIAAGTIALLGLSTVLVAVLIRRRKQERQSHDWKFARPSADGDGIRPSLIDLNDEPLMTWRKNPKDAMRMARQTVRQSDAATRRITRLT